MAYQKDPLLKAIKDRQKALNRERSARGLDKVTQEDWLKPAGYETSNGIRGAIINGSIKPAALRALAEALNGDYDHWHSLLLEKAPHIVNDNSTLEEEVIALREKVMRLESQRVEKSQPSQPTGFELKFPKQFPFPGHQHSLPSYSALGELIKQGFTISDSAFIPATDDSGAITIKLTLKPTTGHK